MRRIFLLLLISLLMAADKTYADSSPIYDAFNDMLTIRHEGTSIYLGNIFINGKSYWGEWRLDDSFNFRLIDAGVMDDATAFNVLRAFEQFYDTQWVPSDDPYLKAFTDREGCKTYFSYIWHTAPTYVCIGDNFFRLLGTRTDAYKSIFTNFDMPRYLMHGTVYGGRVDVHTIKSDGGTFDYSFFYQLAAYEDTGSNTWTELYSNFSEGKYTVLYRVFSKDTYSVIMEKKLKSIDWPQ